MVVDDGCSQQGLRLCGLILSDSCGGCTCSQGGLSLLKLSTHTLSSCLPCSPSGIRKRPTDMYDIYLLTLDVDDRFVFLYSDNIII